MSIDLSSREWRKIIPCLHQQREGAKGVRKKEIRKKERKIWEMRKQLRFQVQLTGSGGRGPDVWLSEELLLVGALFALYLYI